VTGKSGRRRKFSSLRIEHNLSTTVPKRTYQFLLETEARCFDHDVAGGEVSRRVKVGESAVGFTYPDETGQWRCYPGRGLRERENLSGHCQPPWRISVSTWLLHET
jgi:hypothetical protein